MWVTSVSCASFVITCIFVSISCFSLPKPETQFIIGLICFMDVLWYAKSICQGITALSGSSLEFTLAKIFIVIEPLAISTQKIYILYSFHRFSQITGSMGIFLKPHCIVFISTMIIVTVYATNLGPIFDLFFAEVHPDYYFYYRTTFLIITTTVEFISVSCSTSLHIYILRSISQELNQTVRFLSTLPETEAIKGRFNAITRIKKFNFSLFVLQVVLPAFKILRQGLRIAIVATCSTCDLGSYMMIDTLFLVSIEMTLKAFQSIGFALIHIKYLKAFSSFCVSATREAESH